MESPKKQLMTERLSSLVIVGIFKKFQARYLHRWTSAIQGIEEVAVKEWGEELSGLNPEQIQNGLLNLPVVWPPNAQEFRVLCVGEPEPARLDSSHRETRKSRLIESDDRKEEKKNIAKSAVDEMRLKLK